MTGPQEKGAMQNRFDRTMRWARCFVVGGALAVALPPLVRGEADPGSKEAKVDPEPIRIQDRGATNQKLEVTNSSFSHSLFENCRAEGVTFRNVALLGLTIEDANLSDLKIKGAQLGGALFRHIGLPGPDHPAFKEGVEQRPLRFEECDLHGSTVKDSDLRGVAISGCKMQGMTIDGVRVEDLLAAYREKRGERNPAAK
jgi:uncharacterized protein YjbI with pentapeptide repeats